MGLTDVRVSVSIYASVSSIFLQRESRKYPCSFSKGFNLIMYICFISLCMGQHPP